MDSGHPMDFPSREVEYEALRAEIIKRIDLRQQLAAIALTAAAALLAVGVEYPRVALIYPIIAAALVAGWAQNDVRISDLAEYIRTHLEKEAAGPWWENHVHAKRGMQLGGMFRRTVLSHGSVFFFTQLAALAIALSQFGTREGQHVPQTLDWALVALGAASVVVVLVEVRRVIVRRLPKD